MKKHISMSKDIRHDATGINTQELEELKETLKRELEEIKTQLNELRQKESEYNKILSEFKSQLEALFKKDDLSNVKAFAALITHALKSLAENDPDGV